jgi:hypothetical protein
MRLYTRTGATQVSAGGNVYTADTDGAFEFPQDVGAEVHAFHVDGKPAWEDDAERAARLAAEQMEKLRDPATMLAELQKMTAGQGALTALLANALGAAAGSPAVSEADSSSEPPSEPAPAPVAKTSRTRKAATSPPADTPPA